MAESEEDKLENNTDVPKNDITPSVDIITRGTERSMLELIVMLYVYQAILTLVMHGQVR